MSGVPKLKCPIENNADASISDGIKGIIFEICF